MIKLKPIVLAAMGCGLLQACSAPPPARPLAMQPVVRGDMPGNQAASWNRLARFHHERGQLALALGAYAQSLALDANQMEARNAVAVIEAQRGDLESARKALVALVNDYPGESQPHTNLGYVQYLMGDNAGASQTLRRAMALGAGPKAFQNLQLAEAALGRVPAADAQQLAAVPVRAPAATTPAAPSPADRAPSVSAAPVAATTFRETLRSSNWASAWRGTSEIETSSSARATQCSASATLSVWEPASDIVIPSRRSRPEAASARGRERDQGREA